MRPPTWKRNQNREPIDAGANSGQGQLESVASSKWGLGWPSRSFRAATCTHPSTFLATKTGIHPFQASQPASLVLGTKVKEPVSQVVGRAGLAWGSQARFHSRDHCPCSMHLGQDPLKCLERPLSQLLDGPDPVAELPAGRTGGTGGKLGPSRFGRL